MAFRNAKKLNGKAGSLDVNVSVFRNPVEEMAATRRLFKQLTKFEFDWSRGKADVNDGLLKYYTDPVVGKPLIRNMEMVSQECFFLGYFAFVTNDSASLEDSLNIYKLRNEAEVVFKLMLGNLLRTTRVHSSQALDGLLLTTFVALSFLTDLRTRMKSKLNGSPISSTYTIAEIISRLKKIQLITLEDKTYLINVSTKDKQLVEALGFPGLFDSADAVRKSLMSIEYKTQGWIVIPNPVRDFPF